MTGVQTCALPILVAPITAGFHTMNGIFHPKDEAENGAPEAASRPFALHRRGFVLSEGAGALILCSRDFARAHGLEDLTNLSLQRTGGAGQSGYRHDQ